MEHATMPVTRGVTRGVTWPVGANPDDPANQPDFDVWFDDAGAGVAKITPIAGAVAGAFVRATTAMTMLGNGFLGQVAANQPRSWYDPSTFTTQQLQHSNDISAWVNENGMAAVEHAIQTPTPGARVWKLTPAGGTAVRWAVFTPQVGLPYVCGFYIHESTIAYGDPEVYIVWAGGPFGNDRSVCTINIPEWTVSFTNVNAGPVPTGSITLVGDGWYFIQFTAISITSLGSVVVIRESSSLGGGYMVMAGTQVEIGTTASRTFVPAGASVPVNGGGRYDGYLQEPARVNLLLSSADLRTAAQGNPIAAWVNADITVDPVAALAPDGTVTGNLITTGAAGTETQRQPFVITANGVSVVNRFFKRGNNDWVYLDIVETAAVANGVRGWFNLATGVKGAVTNNGTATGAASKMIKYPNGWYLCEVSGNVNNAATGVSARSVGVNGDSSLVRTNNSTRYEWGAGAFNGVSYAGVYIPTTTVTVTRNLDTPTWPISPWYNAVEGVFLAQWVNFDTSLAGGAYPVLSVNDGTANERMVMYTDNVDGAVKFAILDGGVIQANISSAVTPAVNTPIKGAGSYKLNDVKVSVNGASVVADASATMPTVTGLWAGRDPNTTSLHGTIRRIAYWRKPPLGAVLPFMTRP